jgi:hypothetical protein
VESPKQEVEVLTASETSTPNLADLIVGDTVQYVIPQGPSKGEKRPALVTTLVAEGVADLTVFYNPLKDGAAYSASPVLVPNVKQSENGQRGTFVTII